MNRPPMPDERRALTFRRREWTVATGLPLVACLVFHGCASAPPPPSPPAAMAEAQGLAIQAGKLSTQGNWVLAMPAWRRAADQFRLLNDLPSLALALHQLGIAQQRTGDLADARETLTRAAAINRRLGRDPAWWRDQVALLQVEAGAGLTGELARRLEELTPRMDQLEDPLLAGLFLNEKGLFHQSQGGLEEADQYFLDAQVRFETAGNRFGVATVRANLAWLSEQRKDPSRAARLWGEALEEFQALGEPEAITRAMAGQGRSLLAAGEDPEDARELLHRAAENYRALNRPEDRQAILDLLN